MPLTFQARYYTRDNKTGGAPSELADITNTAKAGDSAPMVFESRFARNGRGAPDTLVPPLKAESGQSGKGDGAPIVFDWQSGGDVRLNISTRSTSALQANQTPAVSMAGVRRLMPVECERLQGFPDGWTDGQADSARYRQLGNAVAVPCAEWLGRRIMAVLEPAP